MTKPSLCIFGEVLFDCFPDGKQVLGGAPFNVAWHLQAFGQAPRFISRVGDDEEGRAIRAAMQNWGMDDEGLQTDQIHPTGKVTVSLENGNPSYDIVANSAWDFISAAEIRKDSIDLLYHGTLALRQAESNNALTELKAVQPATIFLDVNLRAPWWNPESCQKQMSEANWVKINNDELNTLHPHKGDLITQANDFLETYQLTGAVVTRGEEGAIALSRNSEPVEVSPTSANLEVVDTVGAGDAFASVFILGILQEWPLAITMARAQEFASRIVGCRGATVNDAGFYQECIQAWDL